MSGVTGNSRAIDSREIDPRAKKTRHHPSERGQSVSASQRARAPAKRIAAQERFTARPTTGSS
jgi:hypothetical protein